MTNRALSSGVPDEKAQILMWEALGLEIEYKALDAGHWSLYDANEVASISEDGLNGLDFFLYRLKTPT